jgi:chromate transporter
MRGLFVACINYGLLTYLSRVRPRHLIFLKDVLLIGLTSFGGAQAHIAVFQRIFVDKRRYLTNEELIELNAMCQMLPGPSSTQTIVGVALKRGGTLLAVLTLLAWMLPAVTAMTLVTLLFNTIDRRGLALDVFRFVQPVAVTLIAFSALRIGTAVLKNHFGIALMIFGLLVTILYPQPWSFPGALLLGGLATAFGKHHTQELKSELRSIDWHRSWVSLGLFVGVFVLAAVLGAVTKEKPFVLFENFYRFGALTFGGGNVLVPMMFEQFVKYRQYLTARRCLGRCLRLRRLPAAVPSIRLAIRTRCSVAPSAR